jgi:hypothetical protein
VKKSWDNRWLNGLTRKLKAIINFWSSGESSMTNEDNHVGLSPTVLHVIEHFFGAMRADHEIESHAIDRLEKILRKEQIPKPDEINAALFDPPPDGDA